MTAAAGNPSAFIFLPAPNRASAVIFPAPLFALSVEAGNALLGIASYRANLDYRTIKNLCSKNNENENPVINRKVIKLNYQYLKEYKDNLEKAVKEYYTKKYMMENFIQKIKKSST